MKILKVMILCLFISFFILGESEQEKKSKIKSAAAVLEQEIMKKGIQSARKKFELLRKDKSGKYEIKEHEFNYLGYKLRYRGKIEEAFEVFKWNTEIFPQSDNAWDSLGGGYVYLGKKDEAIKLAVKAITAATRRDIASGGEVAIAIIDQKGYRELTEQEIKIL